MMVPSLLLTTIVLGLMVVGLAMGQELGLVSMRLEGIKEKCIVEDLPEKTVALVKHEATMWNALSQQPSDNVQFQLLITVKDPAGHTITRQQSKPNGRVFLTATTTGEHLICFQTMLSQYTPNVYAKLAIEVFLGDAGDPNIVAPINAELNRLSYHIAKSNELVADVQREQALQRDRENNFRERSHKINKRTIFWPFLQTVVVLVTSAWQINHLRHFFRTKKLV